jgi:YD repeat-containing protein
VLILSLSCRLVADAPQPGTPPEQGTPQQQAQPSGYTESDISLTAEGLPSSFVNHVNTIFGNFLLPTVDFVIPGPTPLPLIRYYNSESSQCKWLKGIGMSTNYPLWIRGAGSEVAFANCCPSKHAHKKYLPTSLDIPQYTRYPGPEEDDDDYSEIYVEPPEGSTDKISSNLLPQKMICKGKEDKYVHAYAEEDGGSILYFSAKSQAPEMEFYLDPDTVSKGFTNVGVGEISARTNLKNTKFHTYTKRTHYLFSDPNTYKIDWTVYLSNGGERYYRKDRNLFEEKVLKQEIKPNGNKLLFTCGKTRKWGTPLQKIISSSNDGKRNFGWLEVKYKNNSVEVATCNGKYATYFYDSVSTKKLPKSPYITKVESSDQPTTEYKYSEYKDKRLLSKIIYPQDRYLKLEYDDEGRVIEECAPVGKDNHEETIYKFKYHPKKFFTSVYNANGIRTRYYITGKKRLNSIVKYDKNKHYLREEKFVWGDQKKISKGQRDTSLEGHLLSRSLHCPQGAISCTRYFYDDCGNIIKEKSYGNFTGTNEEKYFEVRDNGKPKKVLEKYRKWAEYNNDRFHMCKQKSEESGPTITFQYKQNTDLLTAKFTQDGDAIKIREFFEYDRDAVLVKKIIDDGSSNDPNNLTGVTERHITYITPVRDKEDGGIGQPKDIEEYYLDIGSGKEVLLHHTHYHHYKDGGLLSEEHFDANDQARYTISYEYDGLGNIKEKNFSAGGIQGKIYSYNYDENGNKESEHLEGSGVQKEFHYDHANRLTSVSLLRSKDKEALTQYFEAVYAGF